MADSRPDLDRHALPTRAAAQKVGEPGAAHDERDEAQGDLRRLPPPGLKHQTHAPLRAPAHCAVGPGDEHAAQREKEQQRQHMGVPDGGEPEQHPAEHRVHSAHGAPDGHAQKSRLQQTAPEPLYLFHLHSPSNSPEKS